MMPCFKEIAQLLVFCVTVIAGENNKYISGNDMFEFIDGKWVATPLDKLNSISIPRNKVNIKVFYETLCPGSINFVTNQLRPAAEKLAPYLNIHLVPYGHAKTNLIHGEYLFECQHGPLECYGNKIHACVVDVLRNNTQSALFNACLMEYSVYRKDYGFDYTIVVNWCHYKLNIRTEGLWACINGEKGSDLLKAYGDETRLVGLPYIPYILIDDASDKQDEVSRDLTATLCRTIHPTPTVCS